MKKRTIFTLLLLIGAITALSLKISWSPKLMVGTVKTRNGDVEINVKANGRIEEASRTEVYSPIDSTIVSINVREGEYVQKDAILTQLIDGTKLKSPVDGVVSNITAKVGMSISTVQPIFIIGDNRQLVAIVNLPEEQSSKVKIGQKAEITCPASENRVYYGTVSYISPSAKILSVQNRTIVEATIDIQGMDGLKAGYTAEAQILTERRINSVVVPFDAISNHNGKTGVWLEKDGQAFFSPVTSGVELELETEIREGLKGGERIIISPPKGLSDGVKVEVRR